LYYANIICLLLSIANQDHVHTVRAFDATKPTPTVTTETVATASTTAKSQEQPKQSSVPKEL
jgi:hypothetical protein